MRIVMDARYAGPRVSGIGNYVRGIASRMPDRAPELQFRYWVRPGTRRLSTASNAEETRVRSAPSGLATLLVPSALDALSPDDLFHGPANILGFGLPCPAVVTVHDVMWLDHLEWCQPRPWLRPVSKRYYTTGILRALREARRILTVSQASADAIVRREPAAHRRIVVTPNACEDHFRAPDSLESARTRAAKYLGFDAPFFLVVGQNVPSKDHSVAVRAFAAASLRDHRLVLVQRLETGRGLQRLARELGVSEKVHFKGDLPFDEFLTVFQAATALVQPSRAEGFGLPVLEAMACGCPVIASDIPPLREVLGGAGVLAETGSVAGFRNALRSLVEGPPLSGELRERGLRRARDFSWDRTAALTLQAYQDALRAPS